MSDLFILYCGFMYLFTFGVVIQSFTGKEPVKGREAIIALLNLILAPAITPVIIGAVYCGKNR